MKQFIKTKRMPKILTINELKTKLFELENKRERNINTYIVPLEIKMEELRNRIEDCKKSSN